MKCLITGGAGFIGSHLADALVQKGYSVRVFDSLEPQVHGPEGRQLKKPPEYLNPAVKFILGDVLDRNALKDAIKGVEAIFHLASAVGVGQSMYEISRYTQVNSLGTANLLDILANQRHKVKKLIVASSMSVYGEGSYRCGVCGIVYPELRSEEQLRKGDWKIRCPRCKRRVTPVPIEENRPLFPRSVYAISKEFQERISLNVGQAYNIPTVALRYFNVYGPRQSLSNPYTGAAAIFSCRILNNRPPVIFEDGLQSRDFIHVSDIVQASILALRKSEADYEVFNVGTGRPTTVLEIAKQLIEKMDSQIKIDIVNRFREGDIRHGYADITKIKKRLGFVPKIDFKVGVADLVEWAKTQKAVDYFEKAKRQLEKKGLTK